MASRVIEKDTGWKSLKKTLARMPQSELAVGIPGEIDFSVPTQGAIGAVHEYGSIDGTIPSRSFIRSTFDENVSKYSRSLSQQIRRAIERKAPMESSLFILGEKIRGDVINRIRNRAIKQDLKPETRAARKGDGSGPALIDNGALIGSIISVVRDK